MANSKFLKVAVSGVAVAAIAIGIGVGFGVHTKNKRQAETAASTAEYCRRLLVVPGIEDNVADAPSIRRKLLARRLGAEGSFNTTEAVDSYENAGWNGDTYPTPAPANSYASTKTSSGVTSKGTNSKGKSSTTLSKGKSSPKGGSKKSKSSTIIPVRYFGISVCLRLCVYLALLTLSRINFHVHTGILLRKKGRKMYE